MDTPRQHTLTGVFAPTVLALLPAAPLVLLPLAGSQGTANLLFALFLAGAVSVGTALSLSAVATDAPPGPHPAGALLGRSLGRGVGAAVALPLALARPFLAALAVLAARWLAAGLFGRWLLLQDWGIGSILVDLVILGALAALVGAYPEHLARSRTPALAVVAVTLLAALVSALTAPWEPGWIAAPRLEPALVLALAVPALLPPPGGADGTAVLAEPRRSFPAGTLWAVALAAVTSLLVVTDPSAFQHGRSGFVSVVTRVGLLLTLLWTAAAALAGGAATVDEALTDRWFPGTRDLGPSARRAAPWVATVGLATLACLPGNPLGAAWALSVMLLLAAVGIGLAVAVPLWLQLPSFRPTLRLPLWVPLGSVLCALLALGLLAPATAFVGLVGMAALYARGERTSDSDDARSALLPALLTRATATDAAREAARAWTPRIVVPMSHPHLDDDERRFLVEAVRPEGALHLLGVAAADGAGLAAPLDERVTELRDDGVAATRSVIVAPSPVDGTIAALQVLRGTFPAPSLVYVRQPEGVDPDLVRLVGAAREAGVGVLWLDPLPGRALLSDRRAVALWVRPHLEGWEPGCAFELGHVDLALLTCLRLQRNLGVRITLVAAVPTGDDLPRAHAFLEELAALGRLPAHATRTVALVGELPGALAQAPPADLHVLGLPPRPDPAFARRLRDAADASVLLVAGSGRESARS